MNTEELTLLLARVAIVDGRDVDELTLQAWEPLIGDLDYHDAVDGLNEHYRTDSRRPTPAHIREAAGVFTRKRLWAEQNIPAGRCRHHRHSVDEPVGSCTDHHPDPIGGRCEHCGQRP